MTLFILPEVQIDESELRFETSRSAGPGGQNVNKVETKVTLLWDVDASAALSDEQRMRIHEKCATRINKEGVLRVSSQKHRTQAKNREAATERFADILRDALRRDAPRKPTKIPRRIHRRRVENKRRRGEVKRARKWRPSDET